jgi:gluconolactonase
MKSRILFAAVTAIVASNLHAASFDASAIPGVIAPNTQVQVLGEDFKGTEGPVALNDGSVLFTQGQLNEVTRIAADGTASTFVDKSNGASGLGFNGSGELVAVETNPPSIGVIFPADKARTLVDKYQGHPLNRPNDLVVAKSGAIYFTDPGPRPEPGKPRDKTAVYQVTAKGDVNLIADDIERPNGIQLSPDEKVLYVANTLGEYVIAFDIGKDGRVSNRRNFAKLAGYKETDLGLASGADGLAVDSKGRLYVATNAGVEVFDNKGTALGIISLPKQPQNLAFAGKDKKTLYVVGRGSVYSIPTLAQGPTTRAK